MDRGNLIVIAAPSGTGKTTLVKAIVDKLPGLAVSISHSTRPKRPNEVNGVDYFFVNEEEFQKMVKHDDFLEHATVFKYSYGTSRSWVEETLAKGIDVILEIDWQGSQQIKKLAPESIGIFILPPSLSNLKDRLIKRNQDKPQIIQDRMADVKEAISHIKEFDFVVVNDNFDQALSELETIIRACRLSKARQIRANAQVIRELGAV